MRIPGPVLLALLTLPAAAQDLTRDHKRQDLDALWSAIRDTHPEPFRLHGAEEWTRRIGELGTRLDALDDGGFYLELARLVALLGDGHSILLPAFDTDLGSKRWPLEFRRFEEGWFVIAGHPDHEVAVGRRVLAFGARPIAEVEAALGVLIAGDNPQGARMLHRFAIAYPGLHRALGHFGRESRTWLSVEGEDGVAREVVLPDPAPAPPRPNGPLPADWRSAAPPPAKAPLWLRQPERAYWFEALPAPGLFYLRWNRVEHEADEPFPRFCQRAFAAFEASRLPKLLVDLRGNRGGNNYLTQPLVHAVLKCSANRPGHLFVAIDGETFSAGQNAATRLERETWALFVGEPTGGRPNHCGDARQVQLPHSGAMLLLSTVRWQDSEPRDRRPWLAPDLPVALTFADWHAGRDRVLETVAAYEHVRIEGFDDVPPIGHWQRASQKQGR